MVKTRIWNYPMAYICWGLSNKTWNVDHLVDRLHTNYNVRSFCLEIPQPDPTPDDPNLVPQSIQIAQLRDKLRRVGGCFFGIWVVDPSSLAQAQIEIIKPNFFVANVEGPNGIVKGPKFIKEFRAKHPLLPAGLITNFGNMGINEAKDWIDNDFVCIPEAYQNIQSNLTPLEMTFQAKQRGWKEEDVFPCCGVWNNFGITPYMKELSRLHGYSMYGVESWSF